MESKETVFTKYHIDIQIIRIELEKSGNPIALSLFDRLKNSVENHSSSREQLILANEMLSYLWERMHDGYWKDIHRSLRSSFGMTSLVKAYILRRHRVAFRVADKGILLGSRASASSLIHLVNDIKILQNKSSTNAEDYCSLPSHVVSSIPRRLNRHPIHIKAVPSLNAFYKFHLVCDEPVVISGVMDDWPAITKWAELNYFRHGNYLIYKIKILTEFDFAVLNLFASLFSWGRKNCAG